MTITVTAVDKTGVTEYNVGEISNYVKHQYQLVRFDEVEADLMVKRRLKRHGD